MRNKLILFIISMVPMAAYADIYFYGGIYTVPLYIRYFFYSMVEASMVTGGIIIGYSINAIEKKKEEKL